LVAIHIPSFLGYTLFGVKMFKNLEADVKVFTTLGVGVLALLTFTPGFRATAADLNAAGGTVTNTPCLDVSKLQDTFRSWQIKITRISTRIKDTGITTNDLPEISLMLKEIKEKNEQIGGYPLDNLPKHKCVDMRSVSDRITGHLDGSAKNLAEFSVRGLSLPEMKFALLQFYGNMLKIYSDLLPKITEEPLF
jgi:hypothetical protein